MLFRKAILEAIEAGRVELAFRRWERARVRPGTRMRTAVGLVEVVNVEVVELDAIGEEEAQRAGFTGREDLLRMLDSGSSAPVHRIELRHAGPDPRAALRAQAELSASERADLTARLDRLDRASSHGPWTRTVLELVRDRPGVRAPDLAASLGRETQPFKRDVRKLKELGLTESLEVGYRLSPRGRALLDC